MKAIRNLVILCILGWLAWSYFVPQGKGDRPALLISTSPVRAELYGGTPGGRGTWEQGIFGMGGRSWYHHHPNQAPSHFEVVVTDSTCGSEARYDALEVRVLSNGAGTSSNVVIGIGGIGPFSYLEVDPQTGTEITRDAVQAPYQLLIGKNDETLTNVKIGAASCGFQAGAGSITVFQRQ